MSEKAKQERVFVFIDGSNLYHGLKDHLGNGKSIPIDIKKLCETLTGTKRRLVRILFYTAPINQQENKESYKGQHMLMGLNNELKKLGWSSELIDAAERISEQVTSAAISTPTIVSTGLIDEENMDSDTIHLTLNPTEDTRNFIIISDQEKG